MKVLVTGATGFVGAAAVSQLGGVYGHDVRAAQRTLGRTIDSDVARVIVPSLEANTDWSQAVIGRDAVVHAAARVHVMRETAASPLQAFRAVNVEGTLRLARQAAEAGVQRFVFISSIKVHGESTTHSHPFSVRDAPAPRDDYGVSKREAEDALRQLAIETGMAVTIVRPPLIYGPGVKANFLSMMRWLHRGMPLPFGGIDNARSLLALDNLVHLLHLAITLPAAANRTFLVSDGDDVSTTELLRRTAAALGRTARLIPVPELILSGAARFIGAQDAAQRLLGSLQLDVADTRTVLGWSPRVSMHDGLRQAAEYFLEHDI